MKNRLILLASLALFACGGDDAGDTAEEVMESAGDMAGGTSGGGEREVLYWVAPMDPNYRRDEPGKSPMGMDLVAVYADDAVGAMKDVMEDAEGVGELLEDGKEAVDEALEEADDAAGD